MWLHIIFDDTISELTELIWDIIETECLNTFRAYIIDDFHLFIIYVRKVARHFSSVLFYFLWNVEWIPGEGGSDFSKVPMQSILTSLWGTFVPKKFGGSVDFFLTWPCHPICFLKRPNTRSLHERAVSWVGHLMVSAVVKSTWKSFLYMS